MYPIEEEKHAFQISILNEYRKNQALTQVRMIGRYLKTAQLAANQNIFIF